MGARRSRPGPSRGPRRRPGRHPRRHGLAAHDADRPLAGAVWGRHPVREALTAGYRLTRLLVARGAAESTAPLRELAGDAGVPVAFVDTADLDALSFGGNHQGVVAAIDSTPNASPRDLLQPRPGRAQPPLILAADQVEDVGNLGSLVRTLEACGGAGVIVPQRRSASLTGGLARASAGASLRSTVVNVTNLARALKSLSARTACASSGSTPTPRPRSTPCPTTRHAASSWATRRAECGQACGKHATRSCRCPCAAASARSTWPPPAPSSCTTSPANERTESCQTSCPRPTPSPQGRGLG